MHEIGSTLRTERERQGLTLEEVYRATHITVRYLDALENGEYAEIPGEVYRKGFLRRYAQYLGLDAEDLIRRYQETRSASEAPPTSDDHDESPSEPLRARRRTAGAPRWPVRPLVAVLLVMVAAIATGWALAIWSVRPPAVELPGMPETSPAPLTVPPVPEVSTEPAPSDAPTDEASEDLAGRSPLAAESAPGGSPVEPSSNAPVSVKVRLSADCWFRVVADGRLVYQGTLTTGSESAWTAQERLRVRIGNPEGAILSWNGREVPLDGRDPVDRVFTRDEVVVPPPAAPARPARATAVPSAAAPAADPAGAPAPEAGPPTP